jgi:hypothetical protein
MNSRKDVITLIIVVVSILAIIFGIYLFNSAFQNRTGGSSISSRSQSNQTSTATSRTFQGFVRDLPTSLENKSSTTSNKNTSSGSSTSTSSSSQYDLKDGEIVTKYLGGSDKNFEIVECKIANPINCKPGVKLTLDMGSSAQKEGALYKLTGTITDVEGGMSLSGISISEIQ